MSLIVSTSLNFIVWYQLECSQPSNEVIFAMMICRSTCIIALNSSTRHVVRRCASVKYLGVSWAPAARRTGWRRQGCRRPARRLQPHVFVPTRTREERTTLTFRHLRHNNYTHGINRNRRFEQQCSIRNSRTSTHLTKTK